MILSPVICYCSGKQNHKTDHIECRCDGQFRFLRKMFCPYPAFRVLAKNREDEEGYPLCRYCGKVRNFPRLLVTCPECGKRFKGPKPYFKIDYECDDCG